MLHFYGCRIVDPNTGELGRHDGFKVQYRNLNSHTHNFLRITRILKCLGEFGFEHYKKPFLEHFIKEIWTNKQLPNCADSCEDYWIGTLKNDADRKELEDKVSTLRGGTRSRDHDRDSRFAAIRTNHLPQSNLKNSFSSANYSESSTSSDEELPIDEERKQELKRNFLALSEDVHSSHEGDDDGSGTLDLLQNEYHLEEEKTVVDNPVSDAPPINVTEEGATNSDGSNSKQSNL